MYHSNSKWLVGGRLCDPGQHRGIFLRQAQVLLPRQHPDYRDTRAPLENTKARLQQLQIAPELVDQHSLDAAPFLRREQLDRADDRGKHSALVDIGDQQHGRVGQFGNFPVDDVAVPQIDLSRTACAFDDYQLEIPR